ncbi:MAG: ESPR-type extended signal peptide-containing protein [Dialister invisus]
MNQIYKVIWSRVNRCYVVVSEVAGRCGKNGAASEKESLPFRAFLCALAITGCLMPGVAEANTVHGPGAAATGSGSTAVGDNTKAKGNNAVAVGPLTNADGENSLAAGYDAKTGSTAENSVAIGRGARALGQKRAGDQFTASTIAIGNVATAAENGDIVIGRQAKSTVSEYHTHPQGGNGAVVMGAEAASYGSRGDVVIGAGAEACLLRKDVTAPADKPEYSQGVAIGSRAKVYGTQSTSIGADSRSIGHSSIAIGGDDIDRAKPVLQAAIPDMATTGVQKNFNRELAVLYPGTTLGSAAINDSKNYVNTASIGNASMAIGMMTQSYGTGSTAIGVNTLTKGIASTGIGVMARSWGDKSLALGSRAETYGNKSTAVGDANTVGLDMTDGTVSGASSAAVGTENTVYGNNAYAVGGGNTVGSATITETTEANGDKIKHVTAGTVKGNTAGAFGYKNTIKADNAYTVGSNSTVSADGAMVLGNNASVTAKNGMALGSNTKVANENAIALGAGSETAAAVATPSATINGTAHNFAGVNPASTVSVGNAGSERTITNVAAGRISAASTDAINGSQLYAVTSEVDKGVAYAGDVKDAASAANKFTRKLGEQTNIIGGVTDTSKLTDGNIGVVSNGTDTLNIKLAKNVKVDSVTTGNTVINNNGLTVGGKTYVTNNGLNANNQKVTNVADGQVAAGSKDAVNGGQLHDAKNEVINKGLRFDADNNSEKTNKLGSKVTVNGDNNITTEITQTGDDTKIGVKLNEDIHVKTVTAADTVKAGGVTMGSQTSGGTTGNYVTGLDNKTWNVTNPTAVSGRAATEDQLKTVTEAINNQSAAATDYRLVQNASSADGSYTVDTNGNIDLTVEDKNHAGQKETVKLKDIASKSKLDDVIAKGLQFDANAGGTKTNKLGSKITVKGEGTAADTEYSGENLKTFITQDPAGNTTINVKMNKNLKVETIVATGENGKDGKIGINGKDGVTTNISVTRDGKPGVDGAPGTTTTRIVYEKPDGTKEEVATLNDGMKYGGDTGNVIKKKLNEQVNVVGGITDENKLTTEDNLGVVSDGNNNLKVRLAKALKGLESITAGDTFINNNGITISNGAAGNTVSLTKNGLDNGGNKITNVAAGDVSANSTDAVNGSQLHDVKTLAGQHTTVKAKDSNITVTEGTNGTGGKEYTVGLGDKVTLGTDPSKQVSIDGTTGIIKAGDKVTIDGTTGNIDAGKVKINGKDGIVNGLTNKTWDPNNITSGQAATEDQLKAVDQKITNTSEELTKKGMDFAGNDGEFHRNLGDKVTIKGEGTKAASEYSGENIKTFADANGNLTVKMDKNLKTETIVATGKNGKDGKIGINGKDGVTTNISVTRDGKPGVDGAPGATTTRIVYEKPDGTKEEVATLNDGMKYGGDTGNVIKKKLNEQVNVVGGITDTNKLTTEDNLGVVSDGNNNLKVRMAKDLKGLNSVTTNTLTVGDVKIDNSGINAGNKKITNVAAGDISANSTDAVNGGQLWKTNQTINNIGGAVNELGDRMDRVGAGAAALAALHPLDFDPDDKWDVAAGYGNYKDAHAVSVGAFYRPNEDTMFSVGGSFGGGENMVNAGVSVKLGQGNHVSTSRVALAKEVEDLKAIVKAQSAEIKAMRGAMQSGASVMKDVNFPDVPKDHWAYSYVKSLADRGLLEGYPDGEFKGDRSMTRYEFAAIIYRALQNGAPIDSDMAKAIGEFEPEINRIKDLDRIRVDRISGKDNDRHKVERVRVNNESNKETGDYRDVYGSHISPEA